ncbi:MAG: methyl-accepting chemotaxis protein [Desulfuromonadales bacterium]|nr:methyl-accepting chemotaxis protein [Desulfuromonadales bacterium]
MKNRITAKIVVSLVVILAVIMSISTVVLVERRASVLREQLLVKAKGLALLGAQTMSLVLENALAAGQFSEAELFDTDYQKIESGELAGSAIPKYSTPYDRYLDNRITTFQDSILNEDPMVVFAVLVDRNGYLPTHNSRYSQPLTGDSEKDKNDNRTKRIFNDPVGLKAAQFTGDDKNNYLHQEYPRDTGEMMWDVSAPVNVNGQHWGGFRIGFSMQQTEAAIADLRSDVLWMMGLFLIVAVLTISVIVSLLLKPLRRVTAAANRLADGSLDETIDQIGSDEVGQLAVAFNRMSQVIVGNLREQIGKSDQMVLSVREAIRQLSGSASGIMAIAAQQSSGSTEQATAVQQATTTSEEIAVTARQVAENSERVEAMAQTAGAASVSGKEAVGDAISGMLSLREQVQSIAEAMLELGEDSQKIGGIVDIIDEISDQTNLLSLNAAIEAAGAGEAGKRFSVVANEVKRLAERTVDATGQIKALIGQIQKATNATIMLTEDGTKGVDAASELVTRVSIELDNINRSVGETQAAAGEIKLSTQQQTTASEQMVETIAEVRDVAMQVAESAHETTQAIGELTSLAERLKVMVEDDLQAKGKTQTLAGAKLLETVLNDALNRGTFSLDQLFDENYVPIPHTDPQKYHTVYDRYLDERITGILDGFLADPMAVFAVLVDRNGYLPTHNSKYSQPLTGNLDHDRDWNRGKRLFNDPVGIKAARNTGDVLLQVYERDTGEKMLDISAPVVVQGRHWGGFRIGYCLDESTVTKKS